MSSKLNKRRLKKKEKAVQHNQKNELRRQRELEKIRVSKQRELERLEKEIGERREHLKEERLRRQQRCKKEEKEFRQMREREELMRKKEEVKLQKKREKEERMRKKADEDRLKKETQKWEKEIRAEEKRREEEKRQARRLKNLKPIHVSEAIKKNTSKWMFPGGGFKDPLVFLESTTPAVERLINCTNSVGKKVHTVLVCKMVRTDPGTGKDTFTIAHFSSKTHSMISEEDVKNEYPTMKEKMLESLAGYQKLGSGWRLQSVEMLEIFITKFKPLNGKSYKPFPKFIVKKKAVINMENDDDQCFKWAVTRALNPVDRESGRVTKILKTQAEKYNWSVIEFPTKLKDIHKFEKNSNVNVNVFSFDEKSGRHGRVYTLRLSKTEHEETINLFLYDEHYGVVKNLSRLVSSQLNKKDHKKHICLRCLNHFKSLESLENHLELCQNHDHQRHLYPNKSNKYALFKKTSKNAQGPIRCIRRFRMLR